jgi:hypothetical protein
MGCFASGEEKALPAGASVYVLSRRKHGKYHLQKGCHDANEEISSGEISGRLRCQECSLPHPAIISIFPASGKNKQWVNIRGINIANPENVWTVNDKIVLPHIWPQRNDQVAIWIPKEPTETFSIRAYRNGHVTEARFNLSL